MALISYYIQKKTKRPFKTQEGDMMDYFWYTAERVEDGVTINFGSMNNYNEEETIEANLTKYEKKNGEIGYKETRL